MIFNKIKSFLWKAWAKPTPSSGMISSGAPGGFGGLHNAKQF